MGSRLQAMSHQVVAGDERRRIQFIGGPFAQTLLTEIDVILASTTRLGVSSVQCQQLVDSRMYEDHLQFALAHLWSIAKKLVLFHQPFDAFALGVGKFQASA